MEITSYKIMFRFMKMFTGLLSGGTIVSFGKSLASNSERPIKCASSNSQPYQARPTLFDINSTETPLYPFVVSANKCSGSCNTIDDPYARVCVSNQVNIVLKVYNLMTRVKDTRSLVQHESCECKCEWKCM